MTEDKFKELVIENKANKTSFPAKHDLYKRSIDIIKAGGQLGGVH